jgi:hypothetical protein
LSHPVPLNGYIPGNKRRLVGDNSGDIVVKVKRRKLQVIDTVYKKLSIKVTLTGDLKNCKRRRDNKMRGVLTSAAAIIAQPQEAPCDVTWQVSEVSQITSISLEDWCKQTDLVSDNTMSTIYNVLSDGFASRKYMRFPKVVFDTVEEQPHEFEDYDRFKAKCVNDTCYVYDTAMCSVYQALCNDSLSSTHHWLPRVVFEKWT